MQAIDSEWIYNAVEMRYKLSSGNEHEWERALLDAICDLSFDAVRRRHGRWLHIQDDLSECSACCSYWIPYGDEYDYHYCPNCGAKMDGKEK